MVNYYTKSVALGAVKVDVQLPGRVAVVEICLRSKRFLQYFKGFQFVFYRFEGSGFRVYLPSLSSLRRRAFKELSLLAL